MRKSRAATPPIATAPQAMNGNPALSIGAASTPVQQLPRPRPRHRDLRPLLGHRDRLHVELRPEALQAELQVRHHLAGRRRRGGDEEMALPQPRHRAVVHDEAVLAQHQPVAHPPHRQRRDGVGIDPVEEGRRVRPLHVDLAERRHVADADRAAHHRDLARAALAASPSRPAAGNQPGRYQSPASTNGAPDGHDRRMRRREALRRQPLARAAGARAPRSAPARRAAGRSWSRSRRCRGRSAPASTASPRDAAGLALVGRHPERGVALHVLDRAEALPRRQAPRPSPSRRSGSRARRARRRPSTCQKRRHRHRRVLRLRHLGRRRGTRDRRAPPPPPPRPPASAACVENAPAAAPAAVSPGTAPAAGTKAASAASQTGRAPRCAGQVQRRVPAARHRQAVGRDPLAPAPPAARSTARSPRRPCASTTSPPAKLPPRPRRQRHAGPRVDQRRHLDPRRRQVRRRPPAVVACR